MTKLLDRTALVLIGLLLATQAPAAILQVNGSGILTGATDVDVNGTLYNVDFVEGTCIDLFGGCDSIDDFAFPGSETDALAAGDALANQVFIDGPAGLFDSRPWLIEGCPLTWSSSTCWAVIPFSPVSANPNSAQNVKVLNYSVEASDLIGIGPLGKSYDTSADQNVYADFQPATIPLPAAAWLLVGAVGGLGALRRARRA